VWGLETDFQWSAQKGARELTVAAVDVPGVITAANVNTNGAKLMWLGTLRSRVGFVADGMPNVLWYGTGGLAYAGIGTSTNQNSFEFFFRSWSDNNPRGVGERK
jgi:outer membrane immunogenic protein